MEEILLTEWAIRNGTTRKQAQRWVAAGKLEGARKVGHIWIVPDTAPKPDARRGNPNLQLDPPRLTATTSKVPIDSASQLDTIDSTNSNGHRLSDN